MATRVTKTESAIQTVSHGQINGKNWQSSVNSGSATSVYSSTRVHRSFGDRISSNKSHILSGLGGLFTSIIGSTFALFIIALFLRKGMGLPYIGVKQIITMYNNKLSILNGTFINVGYNPLNILTSFRWLESTFNTGYEVLNSLGQFLMDNQVLGWVVGFIFGPVLFLAQIVHQVVQIIFNVLTFSVYIINGITALVSTFIDVVTYNNSTLPTNITEAYNNGSIPNENYIWNLLIGNL